MAEVLGRSGACSIGSCLIPTRRCCRSSTGVRSVFFGVSKSCRSGGSRQLRVACDVSGGGLVAPVRAQPAPLKLSFAKAHKWWEKGLQANMKEIVSAQDLVDSLLDAGDKLVVVAFFSPGCGGCKALHPKICQLAEMNPEVRFLQINYEEHKSMCYSLNVHVLPFFRFYRGAEGRVCSFSCTNATIHKFKNALAKHGTPRCPLGPPKGLEEEELLALAANRDLSFTYVPKQEELETLPSHQEAVVAATATEMPPLSAPLHNLHQDIEESSLVASGR
ncbi:Thioredoxin-like 1-2, chloroplastic-like protein [Drosera capensis]